MKMAHNRKNLTIFSLQLFAIMIMGMIGAKQASAACSSCMVYEQALQQEFRNHEQWMTNEWWGGNVEPALRNMTDEIRNAILFEVTAFGAFLDSQNLLGAQRAIQELSTTTMKNYAVSDSICKFGTLSRSLAASEAIGKNNQVVMGEKSQNRQLGQMSMSAAQGSQSDRSARLAQFRRDYCDPTDFGTGMATLCDGTAADGRRNIDINFTRAVDTKRTLDVNFTNAAVTNDERDILALASNLYAHQVFDRVNTKGLSETSNVERLSSYLDQRSIVAKRSVAENSFNALVGQKSAGTTGSQTYLVQVLQQLGLNATDATRYIGSNPSYDAQMEVLTKKIYQDPAFYANLMESPANVNRQYAALQSFGLMQRRDIFETISRSEMLLSMILEMEISKYQDNIQNRQNTN